MELAIALAALGLLCAVAAAVLMYWGHVEKKRAGELSAARRAARWQVHEESPGDELAGPLVIYLVKVAPDPRGGEMETGRIYHTSVPPEAVDWEYALAQALASARSKCEQLNDALDFKRSTRA